MPDDDGSGDDRRWKRWKLYAGVPGLIVAFVAGTIALWGYVERGAWTMVQAAHGQDTDNRIQQYHVVSPDGHDLTTHEGAVNYTVVAALDTRVTRTEVTLARSLATQKATSATLGAIVCAETTVNGVKGRPHPESGHCVWLAGGKVKLVPLADPKAIMQAGIKLNRRQRDALDAALSTAPPIVPPPILAEPPR